MAKAAKLDLESAAKDSPAWFAGVLKVRFDEVLKFVDASLDPAGVNGVHDLRVAIRRLRSLLRDFAGIVDKRPLAELSKSLKKLAGTLGRVRDLDVLIEELVSLSRKAEEPIRSGVEEMIAEYEERRRLEHRSLAAFLTGEFVFDLRMRFAASVESAVRQRGLFDVSDVREGGRRTIIACLNDFLDRSNALYDPTQANRLHELRISGKHLRYAIELYAANFGETLKPFADETKRMQSHLGEVHDCDVWVEEIRKHLTPKRRKRGPGRRSAATWLLAQFTRRRTKAYLSALERWSKWEVDGFAAALVLAVA